MSYTLTITRRPKSSTAAPASASASQQGSTNATDGHDPRLDDMFTKVDLADPADPEATPHPAIRANYDFYSVGAVSALGAAPTPGGSDTTRIDCISALEIMNLFT